MKPGARTMSKTNEELQKEIREVALTILPDPEILDLMHFSVEDDDDNYLIIRVLDKHWNREILCSDVESVMNIYLGELFNNDLASYKVEFTEEHTVITVVDYWS